MDIKQKRINEYIELYRDMYGKEISHTEASKMVESLINLVELAINDYIRRKS